MSLFSDEFMGNKESCRKFDDAVGLAIWGALLFGCAAVLLLCGEALFTGKNAFIAFLGLFFILIAAIAYVRSYLNSREVARKEESRWLRIMSRTMLAMVIISVLICVTCIVSLIVN